MIRYLTLAALCGYAQPGWAETQRVSGWDVSYYATMGGCQAFSYVNEATAFFIGYDTTTGRRALDVTVANPGWDSIKEDRTYSVLLRFGDRPAWRLDMRGISIDDRPGLNIVFPANTDLAKQFIDEFRSEYHMNWSFDDTALGQFSLKGSGKAFDAMHSCQNRRQVPGRPVARSN